MSRPDDRYACGELLIARHGQAHSNVAGVLAGPGCRGLTDDGRAAARALARRLAEGRPIRALHASSTRRARETAGIIGEALGLQPQMEPALRVPDPGHTEGWTWAAIRAARALGTATATPTDAETWSDYLVRATDALARILAQHAGGRILVVGHSETVTAAFSLLLGTAELGRLRVNLDYTAISTFRELPVVPRADGVARWELLGHNDAAHVPDGLPRFLGHLR